LLSTLQGYLLCALLPNLLSGLCGLEACLLRRVRHLVGCLLRGLLCRLLRNLLAYQLTDLYRLLRYLLHRLLRRRERN
jgi:hypothetical protein